MPIFSNGLRPLFVEQRRHDGPDLPLAKIWAALAKAVVLAKFIWGGAGKAPLGRAELGEPALVADARQRLTLEASLFDAKAGKTFCALHTYNDGEHFKFSTTVCACEIVR